MTTIHIYGIIDKYLPLQQDFLMVIEDLVWHLCRDYKDYHDEFGDSEDFPLDFPILAARVADDVITITEEAVLQLVDYCDDKLAYTIGMADAPSGKDRH